MIAEFRKNMANSPEYARFAPFFIFCVITSAAFFLGKDWMYWLYAAKVVVGLWLIWEMRPVVTDARQTVPNGPRRSSSGSDVVLR